MRKHYGCYCYWDEFRLKRVVFRCMFTFSHFNQIEWKEEKTSKFTYPISLRHRSSWAMRLGWLVGIKYFSAKSRFFGRCSWHFKDVKKTVLKVPSPIRRWILKILSTSGIWAFNSATSSVWWNIQNKMNQHNLWFQNVCFGKHN